MIPFKIWTVYLLPCCHSKEPYSVALPKKQMVSGSKKKSIQESLTLFLRVFSSSVVNNDVLLAFQFGVVRKGEAIIFCLNVLKNILETVVVKDNPRKEVTIFCKEDILFRPLTVKDENNLFLVEILK